MRRSLLVIIILIISAASALMLVAYADEEISLDAEASSFDYFGKAYYVDTLEGAVKVDFCEEINGDGYLCVYVFSPNKTTVYLNLYSGERDGEEILLRSSRNAFNKVYIPFDDLTSAEGIKIQTAADFIILSGISIEESIVNEAERKVDRLSVNIRDDIKGDYVDLEIKVYSVYSVTDFEVESSGEITREGCIIRAKRDINDYTVKVLAVDLEGNSAEKTYVVPGIVSTEADYTIQGGSFTGSKGNISFGGGENAYTLTSRNASSMGFKLCCFENGVSIKVDESILTGFSKGVTYDIVIEGEEAELVSEESFNYVISDFKVYGVTFGSSFDKSSNPDEHKDFNFPWLIAPNLSEIGKYSLEPSHSGGSLEISYLYQGIERVSDTLDGISEGEYIVYYKLTNGEEKTTFTYIYNLRDSTCPTLQANIPSTLELGESVDLTAYTAEDVSGVSVSIELSYANDIVTVEDLSSFIPKVGAYIVTYVATDGAISSNVTKKEYTFNVLDTTAPQISKIDCEIEVDVYGEIKPAYTVSDLSDYTVRNEYVSDGIKYEFTESFIPNEIGEHIILVTAIDQYGNESVTSATVSVVDRLSPVISGADLKFDSEDFMSFSEISVKDNYDSFPTIEISVTYLGKSVEVVGNGIFYQGCGEYEITVAATDSSGNSSKEIIKITVEDESLSGSTDEEEGDYQNSGNDSQQSLPREDGPLGCNGCGGGSASSAILSVFTMIGMAFLRKF